MTMMLGIDTGGTFTDAVIVEERNSGAAVVSSAKSPTVHQDLLAGVQAVLTAVMSTATAHGRAVKPADIALVSVSTTLATNALVEGHGEPAGLLTCGFTESELDRIGIESVVPKELSARLTGGHDAHGNERSALDLNAARSAIERLDPAVSGFAITSQFSVRNPTHEVILGDLVREMTGKPVTHSHELSARLDGPRRALTAVLNARLVGTIARLNAAVAQALESAGIEAPLMVVRGDGSLVSADFASRRPIETVLSGPAASVIGAMHLSGVQDGLVADIGGTTTDIAVVTNGRPAIAEQGAVVGGHRTMVEAVDMATTGIGGDSEVRIDPRAPDGPVVIGPERAIPLCRLATMYPQVHRMLDSQLAAPTGLSSHGRFLVATVGDTVDVGSLDARQQGVLERLADGPLPISKAAPSGLDATAANRLRARGLVRVATMTPTDATAILHGVEGHDIEAADKVAALLARQSASNGSVVAADGPALSALVINRLVRRSATFALSVAFAADGISADAGDGALVEAALDRVGSATSLSIGVSSPITAIGAPAAIYYPDVANLLGTSSTVPEHFEVANAVGAVVGQVRVRRSATITQPTRGQYRVHIGDQMSFGSVERARDAAAVELEAMAVGDAERAGAETPEVHHDWQQRTAIVDGKELFVEGQLTVTVSGRPKL